MPDTRRSGDADQPVSVDGVGPADPGSPDASPSEGGMPPSSDGSPGESRDAGPPEADASPSPASALPGTACASFGLGVPADVAFAADGSFAVANRLGYLRLHDAAGNELATLYDEIGPLSAVASSRDGARLVVGGMDGRLHFWEARTRTPGRTLAPTGEGEIARVALSPDGTRLFAQSDAGLACWDSTTGALIRTLPGVRAFSMAGDGTVAAMSFRSIATPNGTSSVADIQILTAACDLARTIEGLEVESAALAFAGDEPLLAVVMRGASSTWPLVLLDPAGARPPRTLVPDLGAPMSLAAFDGGGMLAASRGTQLVTIRVSDGLMTTLALPQGSRIISPYGATAAVLGAVDGVPAIVGARRLELWDLAAGTMRARLDETARVLQLSDDGARAVVVSGGETAVYDLSSPPRRRLAGGGHLFRNGRLLARVEGASAVSLTDVETGQTVRTLDVATLAPSTGPFGFADSPDGSMLLVSSREGGGERGRFAVWDTRTGALLKPGGAAQLPLISATFSHDGRKLAVVSVISVSTGTCFEQVYETSGWTAPPGRTRRDDDWRLYAASAFAPDGGTVAWSDMGLRVDRTAELTPSRHYAIAYDPPSLEGPAAFSPDGTLVAKLEWYRTVLWSLRHGGPVATLGRHSRVALTPDGKTLVGCGSDLIRWDVATQQVAARFAVLSGANVQCLFSPDASRVLLPGNDAKLVDTTNGQVLATLPGGPAALSANGSVVAVAVGATVKIHRVGEGTRDLGTAPATIFSIALSPDGDAVAYGTATSVTVAKTADGSIVRQFDASTVQQFSSDGERLLVGQREIRRLADGTLVGTIQPTRGASVSGDLSLWAEDDVDRLRIRSSKDGSLVRDLHIHSSPITSIVYTPDGASALTASADLAHLLRLADGASLARVPLAAPSAGFSGDGSKLAVGSAVFCRSPAR